MLEKSVNFQCSQPCAHEEEKKKPQATGCLLPAQKRPPSHPFPFIFGLSDRNVLPTEYAFPQYCPSHRHEEPKLRQTSLMNTEYAVLLGREPQPASQDSSLQACLGSEAVCQLWRAHPHESTDVPIGGSRPGEADSPKTWGSTVFHPTGPWSVKCGANLTLLRMVCLLPGERLSNVSGVKKHRGHAVQDKTQAGMTARSKADLLFRRFSLVSVLWGTQLIPWRGYPSFPTPHS
ncbi:uncharacterized protein [Bos indicus]|uniref:Uncharacterized protein isoform X1 n=1 Tax=Bos indicus TaxID=9915 RepID=A0ABM4SPH7_BOSIN